MAEEPQERYNLGKALIMLNSDLHAEPTTQRFDKDQLKESGISFQPMSLDRHSDDHPYFFAPYDKAPSLSIETIQELQHELGSLCDFIYQDGYSCAFYGYWDDYVDDNIRCDGGCSIKENWPWCNPRNGSLSSLDHKGVAYRSNYDELWDSMEVSVAADSNLPHIKAVILVNAEGNNEQFFRGEIIIVLCLIIYQMRSRRLLNYMKIPTMPLPITGARARLIEAFYENGEIILRATPLYDFPKDIPDAFPTLAEWFHGYPINMTI